MDIEITPEQAIDSLEQLISLENQNSNIFSAQDLMETLNMEESILNINVKSLDDVPNLLYSEEIYNDEMKLELKCQLIDLTSLFAKLSF
jgi:hypothetical protein